MLKRTSNVMLRYVNITEAIEIVGRNQKAAKKYRHSQNILRGWNNVKRFLPIEKADY